MPHCPTCKTEFPDDVKECPNDHTKLVAELPYQTVASDGGTTWVEIASVGGIDEAFVREMIADLVGQCGLAVIVKCPAATRPVNEMPIFVLLVRTLTGDAACIALFPPQFCIDAIFGIKRRDHDIGHVGITFGVARLAGKRDPDLPELRRQRGVQDRLSLRLGHVVVLLAWWREGKACAAIRLVQSWLLHGRRLALLWAWISSGF